MLPFILLCTAMLIISWAIGKPYGWTAAVLVILALALAFFGGRRGVWLGGVVSSPACPTRTV